MSVFHQIGHDSINLVNDEGLQNFSGMVCSPLNYSEAKVRAHIKEVPFNFKSILDPQLYFPNSTRGQLREWRYYPNDFETADQTNQGWWMQICDSLIETCSDVGCSHVCSPCIVPSRFDTDYYRFFVDIGNYLSELASRSRIGFYQTAIVDYRSIKEAGEVERIASIISHTHGDSVYLIIKADIEPRRELLDADSITAVMKLIHLLDDAEINVFIPFCSTEFMLWKYAGAKEFATGKFFNLRRFTSSRFDEPSGGGGQLPYWFERNLMAYLRESDLIRVNNEGLLNPCYRGNPFSRAIFEHFETEPGSAWLALSWKNYMFSFAEFEAYLDNNARILEVLKIAEKNWTLLDDKDVLMEEPRNNGSWVRQWRIAVNSFNKEYR